MFKKDFLILTKYFLILAGIFVFLANFEAICLITDFRFLKGKILEIALAQGYWRDSSANKEAEQGTIRIPEIGLFAPLIAVKDPSLKEIEKTLKSGAALYPLQEFSEVKAPFVILGHSAPLNWPKAGNYDWIFSRLNELEKGDKFTFIFNGQERFYKIQGKQIIKKGDDLPSFEESAGKQADLILISCWPPGSNSQRIVVWSKLR